MRDIDEIFDEMDEMNDTDRMLDELGNSYDIDKAFEELDEFVRESEALNGVPIRSKEGDVRNLKRVSLGEYWDNKNQIVRPVGDDVVQAYLQNVDKKPFVWKKTVMLIFAVSIVLFMIVHGISDLIRTAEVEASKNYANVIAVDDSTGEIDTSARAEKTELQSGHNYITEDKQFKFTFDDGKYSGTVGVKLIEYLGNEKEITLPKEIQGYPVIAVYNTICAGNDVVEKIIVEAEITEGSFRDCTALKEVIFPASVKKLGYNAFWNTPSLETVTVDRSCVLDANFAGYDIKPVVNYLGVSETAGEESPVVMENGQTYSTEDGNFQFRFENETIIMTKYLGDSIDVIVPKDVHGYPVVSILRSTFEGNTFIEKVTIEAEITSGGDIFRDCTALKEVVFPVSVKKLGYNAFWNTPSLEAITVSSDCAVDPNFAGYDVNPEITYVD